MKRILWAITAMALCLSGCSLLGPETVVAVHLPPLPDHWAAAFPGMRFLVLCPDGSEDVQGLVTAPAQSCVQLACSKGGNTPVLAYPLAAGETSADAEAPGSLRPAGGFFPSSVNRNPDGLSMQLTWQDGPAALVVYRLLCAGMDVSLVNVQRLSACMAGARDPWDLDLDGIAEALARGAFTAYDIDHLPRRSVTLSSCRGSWVLESPFRPVCEAAADGALELPDISLGLHALHSADGRRILLSVGKNDVLLIRSAATASPSLP
jgi:hypothetical protein